MLCQSINRGNMGFWQWFNGNGKAKNAKNKQVKPLDPKITQAFGKVKRDIKTLRTNITEINTQLTRHSETLAENTRLIHNHTSRLNTLEELVVPAPQALPPAPQEQDNPTNRPISSTSRPIQPTNRLVATNPVQTDSSEIPPIDDLSQQEKNILGVFLGHPDMALSYLDIAKSLGKSPNTIKNQIRQISMKASLLDKTIDDKNKNRFKLKKHIKIEPAHDKD